MINLLDNTYLFFGVLIVGNILMYFFNIIIHYFWNYIHKTETLKIIKSDIKNSLQILLVNIFVAIPGYILFTTSYIKFTEKHFFIDFLLLFIGFDFIMYVLHYLSHTLKPLKTLHKNHHSHKYFNIYSLYVMHPFEAFSFGILLTFASLIYSFNFYSFVLFLVFNWLYGVIAHLNTKSTKQPIIFGNHIFHKAHHSQSNCNFGFYTVFWDKIFRTSLNTQQNN